MILKNFGVATKKQIAYFEKKWSLHLPEEYKRFLLETNGGIVRKDESNKIRVEDLGTDIVIDVLFGIGTGNNSDLNKWMDMLKDDLIANTVIIGSDLMQGLIIMICEGDDMGIYYWDDAYNFEESNDECNTYWVTKSFGDIISMLQGGRET